MSLACSRYMFFMAFIAGALALGVSYYLEYAVGLKPCGLCLVQRACLAVLTGVCLLASVQGPGRRGTALYWLLVEFCGVAGMVTAWRQVELQIEPLHQVSGCSSSLAEALDNTPWLNMLAQVFKGAVDCVEISWTLFDLSLPEWSLLLFVALVVLGGYQLLRPVWIACRRPLGGESSHRPLADD